MPATGQWLDVFDPATREVVFAGRRRRCRAMSMPRSPLHRPPSRMVRVAEQRTCAMDGTAGRCAGSAHRGLRAEAIDGGKPLALARDIEIPRAISNLRFFAHAATQFASESHHGEAGLNYTLRLPLGGRLHLAPWNPPLYLFTWKIAPALAAGKPSSPSRPRSRRATATMWRQLAARMAFGRVFKPGHRPRSELAWAAIVQHPGIKAIVHRQHRAARGSPASEPMLKKSRWNWAARTDLVFADSDWRATISTSSAAFPEQRPDLPVRPRPLVERGIYDEFRGCLRRARYRRCASALMDPDTQHGAHWSRRRSSTRCWAASSARPRRRRPVRAAGTAIDRPSRLVHRADGDRTAWGPNARDQPRGNLRRGDIAGVRSTTTALALANAVEYGLSASVFTRDLARAPYRFARRPAHRHGLINTG